MIDLESECGTNYGELSGLLRSIQMNEKEKLRLSIELQMMSLSGLMDNEDQVGEENRGNGDHHDHQYGCSHVLQLPGAYEVKAAVSEAYRELEKCIDKINDAIEELYQMKAEELDR